MELRYAAVSSAVEFSFWSKLSWLKLNVWKLDSSPKPLVGFVRLGEIGLSALSFADHTPADFAGCSVTGELVLFDSVAAFKSVNKQGLIDRAACASGGTRPSFVLLCYPDFKTHTYTYWMAVPAVVAVDSPSAVRDAVPARVAAVRSASAAEAELARRLCSSAGRGSLLMPGYALLPSAPADPASSATSFLAAPGTASPGGLFSAAAVLPASSEPTAATRAAPSFIALFDDIGVQSAAAAMAASSPTAVSRCDAYGFSFSWLSRNIVGSALLRLRDSSESSGAVPRTLRLLVLPTGAPLPSANSPLLPAAWVDVELVEDHALPVAGGSQPSAAGGSAAVADASAGGDGGNGLPPGLTAVGWELNSKGLPGPRVVQLRRQMDSAALADASADLNLSLMRWRMLPGLDLPLIASSRVLLLGAGTLGCHVARDLLAWGFKHLTLVDAGTVSYSNPVRQPLYVWKDVGLLKAPTAAEALKAIHPGVDVASRVMSIPMPDHAAGDAAEADVAALTELIAAHDAVFLLTDTRESRWLPTLLAAATGKLAITVALGFDTYLVMRHGIDAAAMLTATRSPASASALAGTPVELQSGSAGTVLGCYFCGDVVGPQNSTIARTLDQQCTVTRPGCAPIASAMAVELLVSILHHPARGSAPAESGPLDLSDRTSSPIGALPHQIRGFLTHYAHLLMANPRFDMCSACSPAVVAAFQSGGFSFLRRVFDEGASFLEAVTGLDTLQAATSALELCGVDEAEAAADLDADTPSTAQI